MAVALNLFSPPKSGSIVGISELHSHNSARKLSFQHRQSRYPSMASIRAAKTSNIFPDNHQLSGKSGMHDFVSLAHELADAAACITLKYFRTRIEVMDKLDESPVTIADQFAEQAMRSLVLDRFPSHAVYGEEAGLNMPEGGEAEYTWVLDPIDGTKSFITGKPVFGTLIALVQDSIPILGIIDQPVTKERWVGIKGQNSSLNGQEIKTRACSSLSSAYLYTTSPHLFKEQAKKGFKRVRDKVKIPLYGCDCYAYGLLAAGHVDLVVESGLKPHDYLALVPIVQGAGGNISDWKGQSLTWTPDQGACEKNVVAAGMPNIHEAAIKAIAWED